MAIYFFGLKEPLPAKGPRKWQNAVPPTFEDPRWHEISQGTQPIYGHLGGLAAGTSVSVKPDGTALAMPIPQEVPDGPITIYAGSEVNEARPFLPIIGRNAQDNFLIGVLRWAPNPTTP